MRTQARPIPIVAAFLALLANVVMLHGQTPIPPEPWGDRLTLEVWAVADRIIHGDTPVEERLLREAQVSISAMIYGYDFVYTPEYPARGVSRYFELTPVQLIRWGDPHLVIRELRDERTTLYGLVDYTLSETDRARLQGWRSIAVERAAGMGNAPLMSGYDGKMTALEEAIHQAIRDHLRERYFNRPREVTGIVVLAEPPRFRTVAGMYEAQVRVYLRIGEIRPYLAF